MIRSRASSLHRAVHRARTYHRSVAWPRTDGALRRALGTLPTDELVRCLCGRTSAQRKTNFVLPSSCSGQGLASCDGCFERGGFRRRGFLPQCNTVAPQLPSQRAPHPREVRAPVRRFTLAALPSSLSSSSAFAASRRSIWLQLVSEVESEAGYRFASQRGPRDGEVEAERLVQAVAV